MAGHLGPGRYEQIIRETRTAGKLGKSCTFAAHRYHEAASATDRGDSPDRCRTDSTSKQRIERFAERSVVAFCCPQCKGDFQVSASLDGQQAVCPLCRNLITVTTGEPASTSATSPSPASPSPSSPKRGPEKQLAASCPHCDTAFPIHPDQAGQVVACPGCFQRVDLGQEPSGREAESSTTNSLPAAGKSHEEQVATETDAANTETSDDVAAASERPVDKEPPAHQEFTVQDKPRTVQVGNKVVELHTRTREEKTKHRFRKNIFILFASVIILVSALLYFGGLFDGDLSDGAPSSPPTNSPAGSP